MGILRALVIVTLGLVTTRVGWAQGAPERGSRGELGAAPGEDEALYSCRRRATEVAVTFKPESEVKDLVAWVIGFTCKSFVVDPRIGTTGKKVTLIVPNKMPPPEAYRVFLTALATINLTVVARGSVLRIVDAPQARKEALPIVRKGLPDDVDQVVRYVIKPTYVQPEALRQAFTALKSDAGEVFAAGSLIVITDYGSHVREMLSFARLMDVPGGSDGIYTIPVHHADAAKLADKVSQLLSLPAGTPAARPAGPEPGAREPVATPSKILVDDRTNTLLVASSQAGYERVKALVDRLDISLDIEGGTAIHVYPLGSAIAEELAKTLSSAIGDAARTTRPAAGAPPPPAPSPGAPPALDTVGATLEGQVRVIADKSTNALIVMSSGRDFLAIKELLRQLDQPRRQVFIEAMILEVDITNGDEVGTVWHGALPAGSSGATVLAGAQTEAVKSFGTKVDATVASLAGLNGLIGGLIGGATTVLGQSFPSYAVLFQALSKRSNINVLSSPSIIAVDNELAKYKIGTTIPYPTGTSFAGLAGGALPPGAGTRGIDRKELPLVLEIKPHISIDDTVLLEVTHSAMDKVGDDKELGPSWATRSIETRVVVRDQETVVIGGLMQERDEQVTSQIPVLGDLPILGYLFKSRSRSRRKTNLVVMLTPYIVKGQGDLQAIRQRKQREHDEFVRSYSAFEAMPYEPRVDYGKKRGLVEDINRAVLGVDDDAAARGALTKAPGVAAGVIELPAAP